ncbi:MAG: hypothetical protein MUO53_09970 [Maribacter sp.]|nr:hypothetical protein [Maribacter sp.]
MKYPWHLYLMALVYVFAGTMHYIKPKIYLRIMPRYLPDHKFLVQLSGAAEIILGIGVCFSATKNISIFSIISMLTVFFLVHFYMLKGEKESAGIARWLLILRIPLQFALIYWAYVYLKL